MKKKILGVALIATMAVAAGWNFNQSKNEVEFSELAMANVEALALGEGSGNSWCCGIVGSCGIDWSTGTSQWGQFRVTPC